MPPQTLELTVACSGVNCPDTTSPMTMLDHSSVGTTVKEVAVKSEETKSPPSASKAYPPSLLDHEPFERPALQTATRSHHDLYTPSKVLPLVTSKSLTKLSKDVRTKDNKVESVPAIKEDEGTVSLAKNGGKMILLTPHRPPAETPISGDVEGDGPLVLPAAVHSPHSPGKGLRLLVQQVLKVGRVKRKNNQARLSGGSEIKESGGNKEGGVDKVGGEGDESVSPRTPNEERSQVSKTPSLQAATNKNENEPRIEISTNSEVQEIWDKAEISEISPPIAHSTPTVDPKPSRPSPDHNTTTTTTNSSDVFRDTSTITESSDWEQTSLEASPSKPVWMKQQRKKKLSGGNRKRRGGKEFRKGEPSRNPPCCNLNSEWLCTGNVKYPLYNLQEKLEIYIKNINDCIVEFTNGVEALDAAQIKGILLPNGVNLEATEKLSQKKSWKKLILNECWEDLLKQLDAAFGYDIQNCFKQIETVLSEITKCDSCQLGKMVALRLRRMHMCMQFIEAQLASPHCYRFMCCVRQITGLCSVPEEFKANALAQRMDGTFESEYAKMVLLYGGCPSANCVQGMYQALFARYRNDTRLKKRDISTMFLVLPSTILHTVILTMFHAIKDLDAFRGFKKKDCLFVRECQCCRVPVIEHASNKRNSRSIVKRELFKNETVPVPEEAKQMTEMGTKVAPKENGKETRFMSEKTPEQNVCVETPSKTKEETEEKKTFSKEMVETPSKGGNEEIKMDQEVFTELDTERKRRGSIVSNLSAPADTITGDVTPQCRCQCVPSDSNTCLCRQSCDNLIHEKLRELTTRMAELRTIMHEVLPHHIVGILQDFSQTPLNIYCDIMKSKITESVACFDDLSDIDDPSPMETMNCCERMVTVLRNVIKLSKTLLTDREKSAIFPLLEWFVDFHPCTVKAEKRTRRLVWPKGTNPALVIGLVDKLQKHYFLRDTSSSSSPYGCGSDQCFEHEAAADERNDEIESSEVLLEPMVDVHVSDADLKHADAPILCGLGGGEEQGGVSACCKDNSKELSVQHRTLGPNLEVAAKHDNCTTNTFARQIKAGSSIRNTSKTKSLVSAVKNKITPKVHCDYVKVEMGTSGRPMRDGASLSGRSNPHSKERHFATSCTLY